MNEVARRYWDEVLDLHAPVPEEPRREPRRAKRLALRKVRTVPRDVRR